jgi:hypothetical protein
MAKGLFLKNRFLVEKVMDAPFLGQIPKHLPQEGLSERCGELTVKRTRPLP